MHGERPPVRVVATAQAGSGAEPYGSVTSVCGVPEPFAVEDGDAAAGQAEQALPREDGDVEPASGQCDEQTGSRCADDQGGGRGGWAS